MVTASGGDAVFLHHDVTSETEWVDVVAKTESTVGGIDILFNNAGIYIIAPVTDIELDTWNKLMAVNITGTFLGMKHTIPSLIARGGGSIVNASPWPRRGCAPQCRVARASKGGAHHEHGRRSRVHGSQYPGQLDPSHQHQDRDG